jgi:hypothetical protein
MQDSEYLRIGAKTRFRGFCVRHLNLLIGQDRKDAKGVSEKIKIFFLTRQGGKTRQSFRAERNKRVE